MIDLSNGLEQNRIPLHNPEPPSLVNPNVPRHVDQLVLEMMQKDPRLRPGADLDDVIEAFTAHYPDGDVELLRRAHDTAAQGKDGTVTVVNCAVTRKEIGTVRDLILKADPHAFVTVDEVRPLQRGYFRH